MHVFFGKAEEIRNLNSIPQSDLNFIIFSIHILSIVTKDTLKLSKMYEFGTNIVQLCQRLSQYVINSFQVFLNKKTF